MSKWPLGVFASIDAGFGVSWDVIGDLDVPTVQLHAPSPENRHQAAANQLVHQLTKMDVQCTAVFGGFSGESYADIPTVERTVGLVPADSRESRLEEMFAISDFTKHLNCDTVALHLGFIPHEISSNNYHNIVNVTRRLCDHCRDNDQFLHLETGQETAIGLLDFISLVDRDNLKINFDPANMILYGTGQPLDALKDLSQHIRSVHCKDATWSPQPGQTWGEEVPLGKGEVNIRRYLETLLEIGYTGPLTIERELSTEPDKQRKQIGQAIELLTRLRNEILATD